MIMDSAKNSQLCSSCVCNQQSLSRTITTDSRRLGNTYGTHRLVLTILSFVLLLFCVEKTVPLAQGTPTGNRNKTSAEISDFTEGVSYLFKYAYLPQADRETGELRSQEELRKSIKAFQRLAHLNETGEFDEITKTWMMKPRCGLPDVTNGRSGRRTKRYVLGPSKWKKRDLTWRLENHTPKLTRGHVRQAIDKAFKLWSDVTYLSFREVSSRSRADINIRFARGYHSDGYPFDGTGRVLAHAFYPGEDKGGDTHFDDDEPWTLYDPGNGIDLFTVAAHEFGHALGLAHSHTLNSLMYPIYQGYAPDFRLHHDDITAIQILYGVKRVVPSKPTTKRPPVVYPTYRPVTAPPRTTQKVTTVQPTTPAVVSTTVETKYSIGDCNGDFDSISFIRSEYYMFKDKYFWRANKKGLMPGFPIKISQFWYGFPEDLKDTLRIDAVYERPKDHKILFFIGKKYYVFNGNHLDTRFPRTGKPLTTLGLPADIEKIDAAFVWARNEKTYFISGDMYWKYDEDTQGIEPDYPRPMTMWEGVQLPVTTALTEKNAKTYFVKGNMVYEFNNAFMKIGEMPPQTTAERWLNCTLELGSTASPTTAESNTHRQRFDGGLLFIMLLIAMLNLCS